jgi:hypothetical protein
MFLGLFFYLIFIVRVVDLMVNEDKKLHSSASSEDYTEV